MPIVTISRGTFAGGVQLSTWLAERMGCRVVGREEVYAHVQETYGIVSSEVPPEPERLGTRLDTGPRERQRLLWAVQASLCELLVAHGDDVVYHGQAGALLLPGIQHHLRVRVIAPHELRVRFLMEREHLNELEASGRVDHRDAARRRWSRFHYGVEPDDPSGYDLVLNLARVAVDQAAELVAAAARLPAFQATDESRSRLRDLALAGRVRARLAVDPASAAFDVSVVAANGQVKLAALVGETDLAVVKRIAAAVSGVSQVEAVSPSVPRR